MRNYSDLNSTGINETEEGIPVYEYPSCVQLNLFLSYVNRCFTKNIINLQQKNDALTTINNIIYILNGERAPFTVKNAYSNIDINAPVLSINSINNYKNISIYPFIFEDKISVKNIQTIIEGISLLNFSNEKTSSQQIVAFPLSNLVAYGIECLEEENLQYTDIKFFKNQLKYLLDNILINMDWIIYLSNKITKINIINNFRYKNSILNSIKTFNNNYSSYSYDFGILYNKMQTNFYKEEENAYDLYSATEKFLYNCVVQMHDSTKLIDFEKMDLSDKFFKEFNQKMYSTIYKGPDLYTFSSSFFLLRK